MKRKLPLDAAFDFYVNLGVGRSYQAVAEHFGSSKVAVTNLATREGWQKRLAELTAKSREKRERETLESIDQVRQRHLTAARIIQAKGLEALRMFQLEDALSAVRALDIGLKQEQVILGEPTDRTAVNIEEVIKREYERWMVPAEQESKDKREDRTNGTSQHRDQPAA